jgi:hypothetical protein
MAWRTVRIQPLEIDVVVDTTYVSSLYDKVRSLIPDNWCEQDRVSYGHPDDLVMCVIDAIWSINASYERHVKPLMNRVRDYRRQAELQLTTPEEFLVHFSVHLNDQGGFLADHFFQNHQRTAANKKEPYKSYAIQQTLDILNNAGIQSMQQLLSHCAEKKLRASLQSVPGDSIGVRTDYLFMLAGCTKLAKFDRQISRFLGLTFNAKNRLYAIALLTAVADLLKPEFPCINTRSVDNFIWALMSNGTDEFEIADQATTSRADDAGIGGNNSGKASGGLADGTTQFRLFDNSTQNGSICHACYLAGLNRYISFRRPSLSEITSKQYLSDGTRFSTAYREGGTRVKSAWQALAQRDYLSYSDFEDFKNALARGGLSGAESYQTPVKGAFDNAEICTHPSRG